jgi:hypothetical protein
LQDQKELAQADFPNAPVLDGLDAVLADFDFLRHLRLGHAEP